VQGIRGFSSFIRGKVESGKTTDVGREGPADGEHMSSVEICRRRDLGFCPGKAGLRGHAATSNSNEIAGIMRRLLCTSRAPGTTHAYYGLFAEEVHFAPRSIDFCLKLRKRLASENSAHFVSNPKTRAFLHRSWRIVSRFACVAGPLRCSDQGLAR
jgi:hypothetical protein